MKKVFKNRKGITLVAVIIIMSVLIILCGALIEAVMTNIVMTKRHRNIDLAYYAGESAIEKWSREIYDTTSNSNIVAGSNVDVTNPTSVSSFINHIIGEINASLSSNRTMDIDIEGNGVDFAEVKLEDIELVDYTTSGNDIYIDLGIKAAAEYSPTSTNYNTSNKVVYAVKRFKVTCTVMDTLNSAIYAVGDIYVTGDKNQNDYASVIGDVYTFGSFAKNTITNNQYLYGGLMAQNYGKIKIFGNAYSRSFIRTGVYDDDEDNNSSDIFIYRDAIAQCIQSFGIKNRIVGLRNAYTFDDLEMNGSDSVIAINGSFFGLTRGEINHDQSSGIINSAPIHGQLSEASKKSRNVVNGDVILAGGSFKIDEATGRIKGQIEDASVAWDNIEDEGWDDKILYHEFLRNASNSSLLNQFQVWNIVDPSNPAAINDWLTDIDNERRNGFASVANENNRYAQLPDKIRGFSFYEMAANNKLYKNILSQVGNWDFSDDLYVKSTGSSSPLKPYRLDNIFDVDNKLKYDESTWDAFTVADAKNFVDNLMVEMQIDLLGKVQKYATRDYVGGGVAWQAVSTNKFDDTLKKLETRHNEVRTLEARKYFYYIEPTNTAFSGEMDIRDIFGSSFYATDSKQITDIYSVCENDSRSKYYLLVNAKPDLDIVIDGKFNGIIVTAGKVHLKPNADVFGSIIAAGGGEYNSGVFSPKLHPVVEDGAAVSGIDYKVSSLNNGDLAAVKIESSVAGVPKVDFFLGLVNDATKSHDLVNVVNTAYSTIEGKSIIPSDFTFSTMSVDEKLAYLNKSARVNLLKKLKDEGINLFDIF
jgi:type VI protein secretion system component Hcp